MTLPQLRRPLTFVLVANTVANFLVFAPVQILTAGGPQGSTNLIMNEIYTQAFIINDAGSAAASTVVLVSVVLLVVHRPVPPDEPRGGPLMREGARLLRTLAVIVIAVLFFIPLWWVTVSALRPSDAIFRYLSPLSLWSFWPKDLTLRQYRRALAGQLPPGDHQLDRGRPGSRSSSAW